MATITWHWMSRPARARGATETSGTVREVAEPWMAADVRAAYPPVRHRASARPTRVPPRPLPPALSPSVSGMRRWSA